MGDNLVNSGRGADQDAERQRPAPIAEVDLAQLEDLLALTPTQRIARHEQALVLVRALRQAGINYYGFDPRPPEAVNEPRG